MSERLLTSDEIIQLGRAYENIRLWQGAQVFVVSLFGANVQQALFTIARPLEERYPQTYDIRVTALDSQDQMLGYDWNLPWWKRFPLWPAARALAPEKQQKAELWVPTELELSPEVQENIDKALRNLFKQTIEEHLEITDQNYDAPQTFTFQFAKQPEIRFPVVFVRE